MYCWHLLQYKIFVSPIKLSYTWQYYGYDVWHKSNHKNNNINNIHGRGFLAYNNNIIITISDFLVWQAAAGDWRSRVHHRVISGMVSILLLMHVAGKVDCLLKLCCSIIADPGGTLHTPSCRAQSNILYCNPTDIRVKIIFCLLLYLFMRFMYLLFLF